MFGPPHLVRQAFAEASGTLRPPSRQLLLPLARELFPVVTAKDVLLQFGGWAGLKFWGAGMSGGN